MLFRSALEERMELAQQVSSMVLALRKKVNIRVRQPLSRIMIPVLESGLEEKIELVRNLILAEVNVKEITYITDTAGILVKKIKPNFKVLGKKAGALMKEVAETVVTMTQDQIRTLEKTGQCTLNLSSGAFEVSIEDVEISSQDIPGWEVNSNDRITVALEIGRAHV